MQKMLENQRMCRAWRIFLKNSGNLTASEQTTDLRDKKNSHLSSRQQHTELRFSVHFFCLNFVNSVMMLSCGLVLGVCKLTSRTVYIYTQIIFKYLKDVCIVLG